METRTQIKIKLKPTVKQDKSYQYLFDKVTNYILFGGSGNTGKSFHGCEWLLFMCLHYPETRWFMGRSELKELRSTTVITFYKVLRHHGIQPDEILTYNQVDGYFKFHNGSRIDLLALKYEPSDPLYSRFGSLEFTGGFIDEGNGIDGECFEVMKSRIGRCMNDYYNLTAKILIGSNPAKGFLYYTFYIPHKEKTLPKNMAFVKALPKDNTYADKQSIEAMKTLTGLLRDRVVLGKWEFEADNGGIIEYDAIIDSFSGAVSAKVQKTDVWYLCIDPARFGNDSTAITLWNGLRLEKIFLYQKLATTEIVQKVERLREQYDIHLSNIICDSVGLGAGVVDMIPGAKQFIANAKPIEIGDKKEMYANMKTQCSFKLAELMNERLIYINCPAENVDLKQRLIKELEVIRVKDQLTDGTLNIIPKSEVKEEIGHSPDVADSIVSRMYFELKPETIGTFWGGAFGGHGSTNDQEHGFAIGSRYNRGGRQGYMKY